MASLVVDGLVIPVSVAGHPVLDFCNTRAGWGEPTPKEYLHTHAHLAVWARENGLTPPRPAGPAPVSNPPAFNPPVADTAAAVVARAVALRSALYAILVGRPTTADWACVDHEVRAAARASSLVASPGPGEPARWAITDASPLDRPLLTVAWAARDLLISPDMHRVGACPGAGCGWLFTNPRGRRRWCSMAWCGNRDKVRRHAQRSRTAAAPNQP